MLSLLSSEAKTASQSLSIRSFPALVGTVSISESFFIFGVDACIEGPKSQRLTGFLGLPLLAVSMLGVLGDYSNSAKVN
jgi:hypothetical protein